MNSHELIRVIRVLFVQMKSFTKACFGECFHLYELTFGHIYLYFYLIRVLAEILADDAGVDMEKFSTFVSEYEYRYL